MKIINERISDTIRSVLAWLEIYKQRPIPATYAEELNVQCAKISLPLSAIAAVAWVGYLPIDRILHPEAPLILIFRYAWIFTSILAFLGHFIPGLRSRKRFLLASIGVSLSVNVGIITGLTGGDSVYVGGMILCMMLIALAPIGRITVSFCVLIMALLFFAIGARHNLSFENVRAQYQRNDLGLAIFLSILFTFLVDGVRRASWEKSRIIEDARKQSENLLLNILPKDVAEELKTRGHTKPNSTDSATVMFTDFVGFTQSAESMPPEELIAELDYCFSHFDSIMEKHNLEKLKTIGDSYMCAGGIPLSNLTHSVDCVLAGLDILSFMDESRAKKISEGKPFWQLRLGIHTGPLVAGVIGTKKFTYDIWGDTVNVASRMESSGELDRINISTSTYHKIKHFFDCSHRGQVHAKNKGDVDMYLVRGIKRELSISGDCKTPNDEFYRLYQALANGIPIESVSDAYERLSA